MLMLFRRLCKFLVVFALSFEILLFVGCEKIDSISLNAGEQGLLLNQSNAFEVETSTLLMDALPTAGKGSLLIGGFDDEALGVNKFSSFFKLGVPNIGDELPSDIRFDSVRLTLYYTGYALGDTCKALSFNVHRVTEEIEPVLLSDALESDEYPVFGASETLYAYQTFSKDPEVLGNARLLPRSHRAGDSVVVKLNQSLGVELFEMIKNKDSRILNSIDFEEYFHGLTLVAEESSSAVVGLRDSLNLDIYYSYEKQTDGSRVADKFNMQLTDNSYQFNHIVANRNNTKLANLKDARKEISSNLTEQQVFVQAGVGLVTKIKFPEIINEMPSGTNTINRAELVIQTDQQLTGQFAAPDTLILLQANAFAVPFSVLTNSAGSNIFAAYRSYASPGVTAKGQYVFDVTDYVSNRLKSNTWNNQQSLFLSLPLQRMMDQAHFLKVSVAGDKPAIKLNIIYTQTR